MIKVIDDFLPTEIATAMSRQFFADDQQKWKTGWNHKTGNNKNTGGWNWHRSFKEGQYNTDVQDTGKINIEAVPEYLHPLYKTTSKLLDQETEVKHIVTRIYSNSHTYGIDGPCHTDDGSLTLLYYPCEDWNAQWEGGTAFYTEDKSDCIQYASYKFNRAVLFTASIPHKAIPVTRDCYRLRTSIVFKTDIDVNDPSYAEWYYNQRK